MINAILKIFRPQRRVRRVVLRPSGQCYDLQEIFQEINARYFASELDLQITWFGNGTIPRTRVVFGSYHQKRQQIKVNRLLDRPNVPRHVVEFIVYHEMLHHVLPPKRGKNGRRSIHHREFKEREKEFSEYSLAKEYLKGVLRKA